MPRSRVPQSASLVVATVHALMSLVMRPYSKHRHDESCLRIGAFLVRGRPQPDAGKTLGARLCHGWTCTVVAPGIAHIKEIWAVVGRFKTRQALARRHLARRSISRTSTGSMREGLRRARACRVKRPTTAKSLFMCAISGATTVHVIHGISLAPAFFRAWEGQRTRNAPIRRHDSSMTTFGRRFSEGHQSVDWSPKECEWGTS